jgi:hypothetical protein
MRRSAAEWAQRFSLEGLRQALGDLFAAHWDGWDGRAGVAATVEGGPCGAGAAAECGVSP